MGARCKIFTIRTGAGKSSLGLAFFRFLEAQEGAICIGGIDVSTLELAAMRAKLNMIPQGKGTAHSTSVSLTLRLRTKSFCRQ